MGMNMMISSIKMRSPEFEKYIEKCNEDMFSHEDDGGLIEDKFYRDFRELVDLRNGYLVHNWMIENVFNGVDAESIVAINKPILIRLLAYLTTNKRNLLKTLGKKFTIKDCYYRYYYELSDYEKKFIAVHDAIRGVHKVLRVLKTENVKLIYHTG